MICSAASTSAGPSISSQARSRCAPSACNSRRRPSLTSAAAAVSPWSRADASCPAIRSDQPIAVGGPHQLQAQRSSRSVPWTPPRCHVTLGPPNFACLPRTDQVTSTDVAVVGIPFDIAEAITTIARASDELRDGGTKLITLGGDHTVALPLLRSLHRDNGPISVLHFDARLDTWDT